MVFNPKTDLKQLPNKPGVYMMYDQDGDILYIGKAANLKSRVSSYFRSRGLDTKTVALVSKVKCFDITLTHSEAEALLLEQNLIKKHKPPFNILMRDDKSYPYIMITTDHAFPAIKSIRGKPKKGNNQYYGPYPNAGAVHSSVLWLQKNFLIRNCDDTFFKNRSRPCLQHQIKRCSAPCVNLISTDEYALSIKRASLFLEGKNTLLLEELQEAMDAASLSLDFEKAALLRDQMLNLRSLQEQQNVHTQEGNADVIAVSTHAGLLGIYVLHIVQGKVMGGHLYCPKVAQQSIPKDEKHYPEYLCAYITQNYLINGQSVPDTLVLSQSLEEQEALKMAWLSTHGKSLNIVTKASGIKRGWLELAVTNLKQGLEHRAGSTASQMERMKALQSTFNLSNPPKRMECFDISHTFGDTPVASCVVFVDGAPFTSEYRRFNISEENGGNDVASIKEAVSRRFKRTPEVESSLPDILFIDGGKPQVNVALEALQGLGFEGHFPVVGIAKGVDRRAGQERLFAAYTGNVRQLGESDPALHLIQQIRDEAHRFAITGHRLRRGKGVTKSSLDSIPGVGAKKRQALLRYFGSVKALKAAPASEIEKVVGISASLALKIYEYYHPKNH